MSILYDSVFLFQHYVLGYRHNNNEFSQAIMKYLSSDDILSLSRRNTEQEISNPLIKTDEKVKLKNIEKNKMSVGDTVTQSSGSVVK